MPLGSVSALRSTLASGFAALTAVTWCLLVFGTTVRVHGAGLSCPDWPLCYGKFIPNFDGRIALEWGHRVLAGTMSVGFMLAGGGVLAVPELRLVAGKLVGVASAVLITQIVLGGLTVLKLLAFWSVTLHLLTGNAFMVILLVIAVRLRAPALPPGPGPRGWGAALAVVLALQMAFGGLSSSNYAGMACTEWPTCNGGVWIPTTTGIIGLHLLHRLGAYTLLVIALAFVVAMRGDPHLGRAVAIASLVVGQVCLGVANIFTGLPAELAIAHAAVADTLVLLTAFTLMGLFSRVTTPAVTP